MSGTPHDYFEEAARRYSANIHSCTGAIFAWKEIHTIPLHAITISGYGACFRCTPLYKQTNRFRTTRVPGGRFECWRCAGCMPKTFSVHVRKAYYLTATTSYLETTVGTQHGGGESKCSISQSQP